ncbi:hypothetical protein [Desulfosarcina variabilis]|uniref:hypothetical protein n=1 Tax=Desulfosarcina variabilis TaxID=2300 RepID=UPI003AFB38ED
MESSRMSDPAVLVPVPYYTPARIRTNSAVTLFSHRQRAGSTTHEVYPQRPAAPEADAGLVYDKSGAFMRDPSLGWIVNIWV